MLRVIPLAVLICWGLCQNVAALGHQGLEIEVLVDGFPIPEYWHNGVCYIEALKGKEYAIRLTNHLSHRGAVALSVDGLNSIDARHTTAYNSRKWVLEPHESVVISGWQINYHNARRFFFTNEERSYAMQLGQASDLGIISAALFKEKDACIEVPTGLSRVSPRAMEAHPTSPHQEPFASLPSSNLDSADREAKEDMKALGEQAKDEEYAATGSGRQVRHDIRWVHLDLDPIPVATLNYRYEFRPILVKLGILPVGPQPAALERRQHATGFLDGMFCPDPR